MPFCFTQSPAAEQGKVIQICHLLILDALGRADTGHGVAGLDGVELGKLLEVEELGQLTCGAKGEVLEKIVKQMVSDKKVRLEYAQELFEKFQAEA